MSRARNFLLPEGVVNNRNRPGQAGQIDLSVGGQFGYQPDLRVYQSNTGYMPQNIIPFLMVPPRGFRYLPDPAKATSILKQLIETQSKSITGIRRGKNVTYSERQLDGSGRMMRDVQDVVDEISTPTHAYDDRYGGAISGFWNFYIDMLMPNSVTKQPGIMNFTNNPPEEWLVDNWSFTVLYVEPDVLRRGVVDAVMVTNMAPTTSGIIETQRDHTSPQDIPEVSIELNGIPERNLGVYNLAQQKLSELSYVNAGPLQRPAFIDRVDASVQADPNGYREDIQRAAQSGLGT